VAPRGGGLPKFLLAAAGVLVLCLGVGVGLVMADRDDDADDEAAQPAAEVDPDESTADEPPSTTAADDDEAPEPPEDDDGGGEGDALDDLLSDLPPGTEDLLPDDFLDDLSDFDIPGVGVSVTIVFEPETPQRRVDAVREEFEGSDLMSFVQSFDADELDELMGEEIPRPPGFDVGLVSAFGREGADPDEVRDFACEYADDPDVFLVQLLGAEPCGEFA
jgi:hypothetical protein